MLLAIDLGNTNTVFAIIGQDGKLLGKWRASTVAAHTSDELGVWLKQLMAMQGIDSSKMDAAIIASVVPASLYDLKTLCRDFFSIEPLVVGEPGIDLSLKIHMDRPEEVGADRLINAIAAHAHYPGPLVVVDFGTATTFDVVDGDGGYCGGAIAPGVNLSLEALHKAAAKLPRVAIERPKLVIGKDTNSAMQSGIYFGYAGMIEGIVARIALEFGKDMFIIATGGLAPLFAKSVDCIRQVDMDLTIKGLFLVYKSNIKS